MSDQYIDIAAAPAGDSAALLFAFCQTQGTAVTYGRVLPNGQRVITASTPLPDGYAGALEIRCCVAGGVVVSVCKMWGPNVPDQAFVSNSVGGALRLGPIDGQQAAAIITVSPGRVLVVVQVDGHQYRTWELGPAGLAVLAESGLLPVPMPAGTSQGILDLAPDGTITWTDPNRTIPVAGVNNLSLPMTRADVTLGQGTPLPGRAPFSKRVLAAFDGADLYSVYLGATRTPPRLVLVPATQAGAAFWAAVSCVPEGLVVSNEEMWTPFDLPTAPPVEPPPPVVPPVTPEPPTMPTPDLAAFKFSDIQRLRDGAGNPIAHHGDFTRCTVRALLTYAGFERNECVTEFDAHGWPSVDDGSVFKPGNPVNGNQWIAVWKDGAWHAGVSEYLRTLNDAPFSQQSKVFEWEYLMGRTPIAAGETPGVFYGGSRDGILAGWIPRDGEVIGLFVTSPLRAGMSTTPSYRTTVNFVRVDYADRMTYQVGRETLPVTPGQPPVTPPVTPPTPPVTPPDAGALAALTTRVADLETRAHNLERLVNDHAGITADGLARLDRELDGLAETVASLAASVDRIRAAGFTGSARILGITVPISGKVNP